MNDIKRRRKELGLSLNELSRKAEVSPQLISQLEQLSDDELTARIGRMRFDTIRSLSAALEMSIKKFVA